MKTAKSGPGRPRGFDVDSAIATAQRLFQERGYDGVGVAALTEALGINPPSFYAAFGCKAALFERVLDRYQDERLPPSAYPSADGPASEAIRRYLEAVARVYASDAAAAGCLILETARGLGGADSTDAARRRKQRAWETMAAVVRRTHPAQAEAVADFVMATSTGMSAAAREGQTEARLMAIADLAARAVADRLR